MGGVAVEDRGFSEKGGSSGEERKKSVLVLCSESGVNQDAWLR